MNNRSSSHNDRAGVAFGGGLDGANAQLDALGHFDPERLIDYLKHTGGGQIEQKAGFAAEELADQVAHYREKLAGGELASASPAQRIAGRVHKGGPDNTFINAAGEVSRVQMKFLAFNETGPSSIGSTYVKSITSDPSYAAMDRIVVPKEDVAIVRKALEDGGMLDLANKVTDRATDNSPALSKKQVLRLAEEGKQRNTAGVGSILQQQRSLLGEAHLAGRRAAGIGVAVGGGISFVRNAILVSKGEKKAGDAAIAVAVDTAKAGAQSYVVGAASVGVRELAQRAGAHALAKSAAAPVAIAAAAVEISLLTGKFIAGQIDGTEYFKRCGGVGVSSLSGFYVGAAAGAVFGPPGAIAGSIAGFLVSSLIYDSLLAHLESAALTADRRRTVENYCWAARRRMRRSRGELRALIDQHYGTREIQIGAAFHQFEAALVDADHARAFAAIQQVGVSFSDKLNLMGYEEFNRRLTSGQPGTIRIGG